MDRNSRDQVRPLRHWIRRRAFPTPTRVMLCFALSAALTGCASSPDPAPVTSPSVTIIQTSALPLIQVWTPGGVPVEYELKIENPFEQPVTLTSVELETVGFSGAYAMKRVRHRFAQVVPARTTKTISVRAWVEPLQATDNGSVASLVLLRGIASFEAMGRRSSSAFTARLKQ